MSIQFLKTYKNKQVEGKSLTINDSSNLPFVDIEVGGDTEQETRKGKNLFDKDNANTINAYFDINTATISTLNAGRCVYIQCEENTTYTFSKMASSRFSLGYTTDIPRSNVNVQGVITNNNATSVTITTGAGAKYLIGFIFHNSYDTTITVEDILNSIQIEQGSSATSYEPYGVMPSPDYLSDVQVVTGDVEVDVIGKNILKLENNTVANRGITGTIIENNILTYEGTATALYADITRTTNKKIPPGTYTFSIDVARSYERIVLYLFGTETVRCIISAGETKQTVTLTEEKTSYRVGLTGMESGNSYSGTIKMQLEYGSTATEYEPYQEQTQLLSLGENKLLKIENYRDCFKENNKWYLRRKIGKFVYDGEGSVSSPSTNYYNINNISGLGYIEDINTKTYLSNKYRAVEVCQTDSIFIANTQDLSFAFCFHPNGNTIRFKDTRGLSLSDFKTSLIGTVFYYALKNPTDIEITDPTLISQLNNLKKLHTYKGITNINTNTEGLKPTLKVTYKNEMPKMKRFI